MRLKKGLALILMVVAASSLYAQQPSILHYKEFVGFGISNTGDTVVVLRSFVENKTHKYLVVNPTTLKVTAIEQDLLKCTKTSRSLVELVFWDSPYVSMMRLAGETSAQLQNAGLANVQRSGGVALTIDLCPSILPLDKVFFSTLIKQLGEKQKPIPVAISVSGTWLKGHSVDFAWLLERVKSGELDITWINHSYSHRVAKELPLESNFLLLKGTNISNEILRTEITMLEHGILPSVFFRFPGLVSRKDIYSEVESFGLIPVGTDCWIANRQAPKPGSVVLIHGNGNEPVGLRKFLRFVETKHDSIAAETWRLFDLKSVNVKP